VVGVRVFTRRGIEKDERALALERMEIDRLAKDRDVELNIVEGYVFGRMRTMLDGQKLTGTPKQIKAGTKASAEVFEGLAKRLYWQLAIDDKKVMTEIENLKVFYDRAVEELDHRFKKKVEKVQSGDDLPQGALKVVKVYLATKQKIQPGDKMAGRHGNKGVVSRILPLEDMPFLEDGTPVDVVLNPLGVPSRMNVGQILETHLGWAAIGLGKQIAEALKIYEQKEDLKVVRDKLLDVYNADNDSNFRDYIKDMSESDLLELANNLTKGVPFATPVFDGAKDHDISRELVRSNLATSGQVTLIDGRTGEPFERKVTVGCIYMIKLDHLVDDKIHARSIGPYSLVTQQPLGGKSHFGGQRFGEMECWALQAYGAAYTLQEILTVKSDDVTGRIKIYESIVRGDSSFESGIPESFNVMIKELRSLCLNVEMQETEISSEEIQDIKEVA
jgi:DNA-directed RNA polymerase subunit beta